jgi:hypothetical protein
VGTVCQLAGPSPWDDDYTLLNAPPKTCPILKHRKQSIGRGEGLGLAVRRMMDLGRTFLKSRKLLWSAIAVFAVVDAAGLYMLFNSKPQEAPRVAPATAKLAKPIAPPPPAMIEPPAVAMVLKSGTLIVISKTSQTMFVFSNGALWASTPISTGKRRHETPSGVFPILQKRKFHRSNIYSNAPMPFMQRLTWDGIALHAGRVPGYAASHGCVRMPHAFAQALFKLTNASATTVVIGDVPLQTDVQAQQFALVNQLPVRAALAPIPAPKPVDFAGTVATPSRTALAAAPPAPVPAPPVPPPLVPLAPASVPGVAAPPANGQIVQLAAAPSQAEAEAHWARLLQSRPELRRFQKTVQAAQVKSQLVYRLRMSGSDAHSACATLNSEGVGCFSVP